MNTADIIKMAIEAHLFDDDQDPLIGHLKHFAALVTQAERESRQAAQAENEQLKARLARSGVELRRAVRNEREACKAVCTAVAAELGGVAKGRFVTEFGKHTHQAMAAGAVNCASAIEARNHIVGDNKMVQGLALDSGEFVPAEKITDWAAA